MNLSVEKQRQVFKALLRLDFKSFVVKVFKEVSPNNDYLDNWHVDLICSELMKIHNNDNPENRIIINIPPRYLKSIICSVAYPAFVLGLNAKAELICVSYSDELASKFALDTRRVMETSWYRELFPRTVIAKDRRAINDFNTTQGGGRYATSVHGTLTGRGADYIIIDDPIKPMDCQSDTLREKTNEWYGHTLYSRLNDKKNGKIVVIMQRLHDEDFTGYLLANDPSFNLLRLQAIATCDETWTIYEQAAGKVRKISRKTGDALHPQREDIGKLNQVRSQMGEYFFSGQYQQDPAPREGAIIKEKWLKYYNSRQLQQDLRTKTFKIHNVVQSWDTACKAGQHNDYSVCITALMNSKDIYYVVDVYREKLEFPELIRTVKDKYDRDYEIYGIRPNILIEDHGSGTQLIQVLYDKHKIVCDEIKPEYDKATRLRSVSHLIENGSCLFPDDTPDWWEEFRRELLRFPKTKHDDQCDALSQMLSSPPIYYPKKGFNERIQRKMAMKVYGLGF